MMDRMPFDFLKTLERSAAAAALALVLIPPVATASTQDTAALPEIRAKVQDHRTLAQEHGAILVAEITRMQSIPRATCKSGVEHRVTYRVVENLWVEPDSPVKPGYIVSKGFIDCREKQLATPPFAIGAKVLLYCGRLDRYGCLPPTLYTDESLHRVQSWLDALRSGEGDPALLQIHERLLYSAELLRKVPPGRPVVINGELGQPFLFTGQVRSIEPLPSREPVPMSVRSRRYLKVAVSKVLWGEFIEPIVQAWCNSLECGGAQPNDIIILHCQAARFAECSSPSVYSDEKLKKLESWVAEQNFRYQRVTVPESVQRDKLIRKTEPDIPELARQARISGRVILYVILGADGTVEQIQIISGHPLLTQSVIDAVRQWRYKPTLIDGAPVEVETQVSIEFHN